jgi:hypothetical protein
MANLYQDTKKKRTLKDIVDPYLPRKKHIVPALEWMLPSAAGERGKKGGLFELAVSTPVIGKTLKAARAAKRSSPFINRMLKVSESGQPARDIVAVQMSTKNKTFIQPFYKSSGTSVDPSKKGTWFPFLGKTQSKGRRLYKDQPTGEPIVGSEGWFMKGYKFGAGSKDYRFTAFSPEYIKYRGNTIKEAMGPYGNISKQISKLEKSGYYKHGGTATSSQEINKWLEGYGHYRPKGISY